MPSHSSPQSSEPGGGCAQSGGAEDSAEPATDGGQANQRCPRCSSVNTAFAYWNNGSKRQARWRCRGCQRHWTLGGTLRAVPTGAAIRKKPKVKSVATSKGHGGSGKAVARAVAASVAAAAGAGGQGDDAEDEILEDKDNIEQLGFDSPPSSHPTNARAAVTSIQPPPQSLLPPLPPLPQHTQHQVPLSGPSSPHGLTNHASGNSSLHGRNVGNTDPALNGTHAHQAPHTAGLGTQFVENGFSSHNGSCANHSNTQHHSTSPGAAAAGRHNNGCGNGFLQLKEEEHGGVKQEPTTTTMSFNLSALLSMNPQASGSTGNVCGGGGAADGLLSGGGALAAALADAATTTTSAGQRHHEKQQQAYATAAGNLLAADPSNPMLNHPLLTGAYGGGTQQDMYTAHLQSAYLLQLSLMQGGGAGAHLAAAGLNNVVGLGGLMGHAPAPMVPPPHTFVPTSAAGTGMLGVAASVHPGRGGPYDAAAAALAASSNSAAMLMASLGSHLANPFEASYAAMLGQQQADMQALAASSAYPYAAYLLAAGAQSNPGLSSLSLGGLGGIGGGATAPSGSGNGGLANSASMPSALTTAVATARSTSLTLGGCSLAPPLMHGLSTPDPSSLMSLAPVVLSGAAPMTLAAGTSMASPLAGPSLLPAATFSVTTGGTAAASAPLSPPMAYPAASAHSLPVSLLSNPFMGLSAAALSGAASLPMFPAPSYSGTSCSLFGGGTMSGGGLFGTQPPTFGGMPSGLGPTAAAAASAADTDAAYLAAAQAAYNAAAAQAFSLNTTSAVAQASMDDFMYAAALSQAFPTADMPSLSLTTDPRSALLRGIGEQPARSVSQAPNVSNTQLPESPAPLPTQSTSYAHMGGGDPYSLPPQYQQLLAAPFMQQQQGAQHNPFQVHMSGLHGDHHLQQQHHNQYLQLDSCDHYYMMHNPYGQMQQLQHSQVPQDSGGGASGFLVGITV